jgi:hypothetical protein
MSSDGTRWLGARIYGLGWYSMDAFHKIISSAPEAWGKNPRRTTRRKSVLGHTASCNTCHDGAGRPPRRQNRRQPILDDPLPAHTAGVVLDHTRSSWQAVEGCWATPSRRVPSHAIRADLVSHQLSRREARWHRASTPPLSPVLDSLFRASSMAERLGARHHTSRQTVLDHLWSSRTS